MDAGLRAGCADGRCDLNVTSTTKPVYPPIAARKLWARNTRPKRFEPPPSWSVDHCSTPAGQD